MMRELKIYLEELFKSESNINFQLTFLGNVLLFLRKQ